MKHDPKTSRWWVKPGEFANGFMATGPHPQMPDGWVEVAPVDADQLTAARLRVDIERLTDQLTAAQSALVEAESAADYNATATIEKLRGKWETAERDLEAATARTAQLETDAHQLRKAKALVENERDGLRSAYIALTGN